MKRALVLCGGGSLGSYEVGAWKFLRERGLDRFDLVTGTSIGAINGALVVSGDFENAERLWKTVAADKIISHGINVDDRMWDNFTKANFSRLMTLGKDYLRNGGVDISPLIGLMKNAIDPQKVLASPIGFAVTTATFPGLKQHNVDIKKCKEDEVMDWLLASSACYPIFPIRTIHGHRYVDGGYNDNLPIDLALKMGAEEIVAVLLHAIPKVPQHPELMDLPLVTTVRPSRDTGSIMNFNSGITAANMDLGYFDAARTFGECWGRGFAFEKDESLEPRFRSFVVEMARENLFLLPKTIKALSREGPKPTSNLQLYIWAIELMGDWLGMDYLKTYRIDDFLAEVRERTREQWHDPSAPRFLLDHNWGRRIEETERKPFLGYMDYIYTNDLRKDEIGKLAEGTPEILALMALFAQFKATGWLA
ncbi:MAG: patatin-like phospholipase family protein [Bacilli bacterium]|jgi:predicted acylesterase/phospholipase RssA|nr:patatin-like phospholipase family protein [Bacilli bacterium]